MVKVKGFRGAVFKAEHYSTILEGNIQHLESVPMSKTFKTKDYLEKGLLKTENRDYCYVYQQEYLGHVSRGIMGEISLQDYHTNKIKRHEKTLHRPTLNHETYRMEHVGPVVVSHRANAHLDQLVRHVEQNNQPYAQWTTLDGRIHKLWSFKMQDFNLAQKFEDIDALYILDGHHRLEAAHQNYLLEGEKSEESKWIQAIIYSSQYIMVHSQHRILPSLANNQMLGKLLIMEHLEIQQVHITDIDGFMIQEQLKTYEILLKNHDHFYGINFRNVCRNVLEKVSTFRLQNEILRGLLEEDTIGKIRFMPGIIEQSKICENDMVFFVREPLIETVFQIADLQVIMPPKSTWMEPKPCSHMVIRLLSDRDPIVTL